MSSLKEFLNTLFDPNEYVWLNPSIKGCPRSIKVKHIDEDGIEGYDYDEGMFFVLHPAIDDDLIRNGDNSKGEFRNFLVEFDDIGIDEQLALVDKLHLPYSTAVFSGGKSIHYVISLEEPLEYDEYLKYFNIIQQLTLCDTANKCKVRYSRLPTVYRDGTEQKLLEVNKRIPNDEFFRWINSPTIRKIRLLNSYEKRMNQQKKSKQKGTSDGSREGVKDLISWYIHEYLDMDIDGVQKSMRCPVCASDGHDRSEDNLIVSLPDYSYRCWYDPEDHNARMLPIINRLKSPIKREGSY